MKNYFNDIADLVGNTPLVKLKHSLSPHINLFAKLEGYNPTGSVKDRAGLYVLTKELKSGKINKKTKIIESSSGNFAISLAFFSKKLRLDFTCVIDPNITSTNEVIVRSLGVNVIKVSKKDKNGGYLLTRIAEVKKFVKKNKNSYWVNQYTNLLNADAYYHSLGDELIGGFSKIDYIFLGVSSGGTITGVSRKIKKASPSTKIIAVDVKGSVIFGQKPQKRFIPGIGSSLKPAILKDAIIDDIVIVDEISSIKACREILTKNVLLCGGSSGSVFAAVKKYFSTKKINSEINAIIIFPDRGERYLSTIYNNSWVKEKFTNQNFV